MNYYRRVVSAAASNASACTWNSNVISITTGTNGTLTAPVASAASAVTCSSFTANWGSVAAASSYRIDVSTNSGFTAILPAYNNLDVGLVTSFNVSGLSTANTTYYYRIKAYNGCSNSTTTNASANVITVVMTSPTITIGGTTTVCQNATAPSVSFTNSQNSAITVTYNINGNTNTTLNVPANSTANVTVPTTASGSFTYNLVSAVYQAVPTCSQNLTGSATITVNPIHTISAGTNQSVCQDNTMSSITMTLGGGATGATVTGLPTGVTYSVSGTNLTISGTPRVSGQFTYNVTTTGNSCTAATTSGTITVVNNTISYSNGTSGSVCGFASENGTVNFVAPTGTYFNTVRFASYGLPDGNCGAYSIGSCHSNTSQSATETRLLGNSNTVSFLASNGVFGDPCVGTVKNYKGYASYSMPICAGITPGTITGSDPIGGSTYSYEWQSSTSATGTFTPIASSNTKDYTPGILTQSTYYRRVLTSNGCSSISAIVLIKVNPLPTSNVSGTTPICNGGSTTVSVALTGTAPWDLTYSDGSASTNVTNITASPYTFSVNPTSTKTYTVTALSDANCTSVAGGRTGSAVITVNPRPTATISGTTTTCYGASTPVSVQFTGTGPWNISYTYGGVSGTFSTNSNPYNVSVNPTSTTTYSITALSDANCTAIASDISAGATITVRPQFTAGSIQGTGQTICYGQNPSQIGNTTAASGGDGSITYQWQSSTDAAFTAPTTISSNTLTYTPTAGLTASMWYRRQAKDGTCNTFTNSTNVWAVTVRPQFTAGAINSTGETICSGGTPSTISSTTAASGGDGNITYQWQANGVNITGANNATYTPPVGLTTTTTYTRFANDGTCNTATVSTGSWTITVNPIQTTPTVGTKTDVTCLNQGTIPLSGLPSGSWQINQIGPGSATSSFGGAGSTTTVTGLAVGTYKFTVQTATTCVSAETAPVTITDESSTEWDGSNWSHGLPDNTKSVVIKSTAGNPFPNDIEGCSLTIDVASGFVTVPTGRTLTITNAVNGNGKLLFKTGSSLIQKNASIANTTEIVYERETYVRRYDGTYWSMPVTKDHFKMVDFSPNTLADKYLLFSPSAGWVVNYGGTEDMKTGKGYGIRAPQSNDINTPELFKGVFTGTPNNGNIPVTVESGLWNLVGNPYPSAISARTFLDDNPGVGAIYLWAHQSLPVPNGSGDGKYYYTDDFTIFNSLGAAGNPYRPFLGYIAATQGFLIKAPAATTTINFNNLQRLAGNNSQFYKTAESAIERNRVWINLTNTTGTFKQILLGYATGATNAIDVNFDALSMASTNAVDFYSINSSKKMVIQGRALPFLKTDTVPLGIILTAKGEYTIAIDHADGFFNDGQDIYLQDKTTGKTTNLRLANYTFTSEAGSFNSRFVLRYTDNTLGTDDFDSLENSVLVSVKNKTVKITSSKESIKEVNIFNIGAQLMYTKNNVNSSELEISNLHSSDQALLVKITLENGHSFTKKIIYSNL